jgi:hypothetical protein
VNVQSFGTLKTKLGTFRIIENLETLPDMRGVGMLNWRPKLLLRIACNLKPY